MPTTAGGFPVPEGIDPADVPGDMSTLAVAIRAALSELIPPGTLSATATASAPTGWLLCQGQAVSRTTYAALYAALGGASSPYGQGDGTTTFNLPDLRGRVPVGEDGTAGRLTANDALGQFGGAEKHTLTAAEMPSHTHNAGTLGTAGAGTHAHAGTTNGGGAHNHASTGQFYTTSGTGAVSGQTGAGFGLFLAGMVTDTEPAHTHTFTTATIGNHTHDVTGATDSAGSSGAHNNMQPYQVVNWMVKT